jgi:hypothetical protein
MKEKCRIGRQPHPLTKVLILKEVIALRRHDVAVESRLPKNWVALQFFDNELLISISGDSKGASMPRSGSRAERHLVVWAKRKVCCNSTIWAMTVGRGGWWRLRFLLRVDFSGS